MKDVAAGRPFYDLCQLVLDLICHEATSSTRCTRRLDKKIIGQKHKCPRNLRKVKAWPTTTWDPYRVATELVIQHRLRRETCIPVRAIFRKFDRQGHAMVCGLHRPGRRARVYMLYRFGSLFDFKGPILQGSWDLVSRVITKATILTTPQLGDL